MAPPTVTRSTFSQKPGCRQKFIYFAPIIPVGLTTSTRTKRPNSTTGTQLTGMKMGTMPSRPPRISPPKRAPKGLPKPPRTQMTKDFNW